MATQKKEFREAELISIRSCSFRVARSLYGVGYLAWKRLKSNPSYVPYIHPRHRSRAQSAERVLASVRDTPHLNTVARAKALHLGASTVQEILKEQGLGNLNARLRFAGYQVEVLRPLQVARLRRIVALYPGAITHIDFKTFGIFKGRAGQTGFRVGGYTVIDSFTGFASVLLAPGPTGRAAARALRKHTELSPFPLRGVVLSDNGPADFLSDEFMRQAAGQGLLHRTTRYNHPWSNGKVEALNKSLKYQCFPALVSSPFSSLDELQKAVDTWMLYYNGQRAHYGHMNRGLPPLALYGLWKQTPGDGADKLISMGVIRPSDEWSMRRMGDSLTRGAEFPYAVVLQKRGAAEFSPGPEASLGESPSREFVFSK